ncbi:MAG: radical SAM protein [Bacteroidia bacterium]|nr:radical SAM protein [Bacteroidia bacterium]
MLDKFNRDINYLRISVTDRCNLRCRYCMPEKGITLFDHAEILSYEEITEVVKTGVKFGIEKIRITGGEPLVRKGLINLVSMISRIDGIKDLSMTTNAVLLDGYAAELAKAGLKRINISLDTLDAETYKTLTRGGDLTQALKGIEVAKNAGFAPVKINCVIKKSSEEKDAREVKKFCEKNGFQIRFIRWMNLENGDFSAVEGGDGGNCTQCNRLRLTANGILKPCLFSDIGFNIRETGIEQAFLKVIENKPECGTFSKKGKFYNIGG